MIIKIWRDSKNLDVVITKKFTRMKGKESITVKSPNHIISYQQHMDGLDNGDQNRVMVIDRFHTNLSTTITLSSM